MIDRRAIAAAALVLAGCATPAAYGPLGPDAPYGFSDHPNADGSHTILVVADSAPNAQAFWDQRATEICGSAAFQKNIFRAQRPVETTTGYTTGPYGGGNSYQEDQYGAFYLEGYLRCAGGRDATAAPADVPQSH